MRLLIVEDEPPVCADIRNNNLSLRQLYFVDISFSSWYVHKKHVRDRNYPEEVGSVVTSCALYCAACEFGMIGMLANNVVQALPGTVLKRVEILRLLECCTTPLLVEKEDWLVVRIGLVLNFQFSVVWVPAPSDDPRSDLDIMHLSVYCPRYRPPPHGQGVGI